MYKRQGIVCEVMAVLVMNGTLFLPGPTPATWLIIFPVSYTHLGTASRMRSGLGANGSSR